MCQRSLGQGKHRLDAQALDHVVNELFPTAQKAVLTTAGGDPLAVDFDFLLERALRFDVRLDVVTNGLLLSRDTYRRARPALDHLNISLDSHVPAVYEHIRAGSSFARVWRNLELLAEERHRRPIYSPVEPAVVPCDGGFAEAAGVARVTTERVGIDTAVATATGIVALRAGALEWRTQDLGLLRRVDLGGTAAGALGTCVHELTDGALLVGFAEAGALLRVEGGACTRVLECSDPRSFVRTWGVATARDGTVWVGEYGVFPGARCAWLYRSTDGGRSFVRTTRLAQARHVHRVLALADGSVAVTTGDLAAERCLYRADAAGRLECLSSAWSGFVAALERETVCHFGTELLRQNGLLAYRRGLAAPPEYRPFPAALDLKVRAIVLLDDGTLLALLGMDENLPTAHSDHRPTLLASRDDGRTWVVVHRFAADWSDEPDDLVPMGGTRVWAIGGTANHTIEIAWPR